MQERTKTFKTHQILNTFSFYKSGEFLIIFTLCVVGFILQKKNIYNKFAQKKFGPRRPGDIASYVLFFLYTIK